MSSRFTLDQLLTTVFHTYSQDVLGTLSSILCLNNKIT